MRITFLQIKKIVGLVAALVFVVATFAFTYFDNTFVTYPRSPDLELAKTVPYAVKGIMVYITHREYALLSWLSWIQYGSGILVAIVVLMHRGDPFRSR